MISQAFEQIPLLRTFYADHKERNKVVSKWLLFRQEHALYYAPVLLGTGIAGYFSLLHEPDPAFVFNLWLLTFALVVISAQLYVLDANYRFGMIAAGIICLLVSGFYLAQKRTIAVYAPMLTQKIKFANVQGTVNAVDILAEKNTRRLLLTSLDIEDLKPEKTPYSVRIKVRGGEVYRPGDRVSLLASLNPPSSPVAPGAFDFQRQSYFNRLGAVGFAYDPPEIVQKNGSQGFSAFWEKMRLDVAGKIKQALPSDLQGVAITFMTGEKSSISERDLQAMRDSGLAHLLAISGLHVGLVAGFVFFFMRLSLASFPHIALKYSIKKWAACAALIAAFAYMFLVGASVPTQRAMMMTGVALFAIMIDRSPFSLRMVALAAFIILVSYPEALVSASFQMSFAAVTALVAFYDAFRTKIQFLYKEAGLLRKAFLYIVGIATTTLVAGSATALFGIYHFQAWSLYSTLANVLTMPVVGMIVMPAAVLSYLLMPVGSAELPLTLMGIGIGWVLDISHYVASLDGAVIVFSAFPTGILCAMTLSLLFVIFGPRILRVMGCVFFTACILILFFIGSSDKVLVSDRGELVGYYKHDEQVLYMSTLARESYVRENWTRLLGLTSEQVRSFGESHDLLCDTAGCRLETQAGKIALSRSEYGLRQDCRWADILITKDYAPYKCAAEYVLDRAELSESGAMQIRVSEKDIQIWAVSAQRGHRLWTQ